MAIAMKRLMGCVLLLAVVGIMFKASAEERTVFTGSIVDVPVGAQARAALTDEETSAPMEFMVSLKMRDFAGLQARIAKGEMISPQEMAAKYFPLEADFANLKAWAAEQGLAHTMASSSRLNLFLSGSVKQVKQALQINVAKMAAGGNAYISAITAPSLPTHLSAAVLGVHGLQPHIQRHKHIVKAEPKVAGARGFNPNGYIPKDILKGYGGGAIAVDGSGQKIAIIIDSFPDTSDLTKFWTTAGINQSLNNIELINAVGGTLPAPSGEETLDVEWTSGMAAGAKVRVYGTKDLSDLNLDKGYNALINDIPTQPTMHQLSLSFGTGELNETVTQMQSDSQLFATMIAMGGITVFCSSGDEGSQTDDNGNAHKGPFQVESPGNDSNVTSVGGTTLNLNPNNGGIDSESAWSDTGGGVGTVFSRPSWQTGAGVPSGSFKFVPDVASAADPDTGCLVIQGGQANEFGGTSWSAPTWAGICALINQARANNGQQPIGLLGPKIYPFIGTSKFQDVTSGNNGPNGMWDAGAGYDLCTGIGTPNISALLASMAAPSLIVFASSPSATPNPASANQDIAFSTSATSVTPVTITWDFGDGTSNATGSSVTHSYSTAGTFIATATADDGSTTKSQTVSVTVIGQFVVTKSALRFNLKSQSDSYSFTGSITVPANFTPLDTPVSITIGGYTNTVMLNKTGKGGFSGNQISVTGKLKKGVFTSTSALLKVTLSRQDLFDSFAVFGFTDSTVTSAGPFQITATVTIDGSQYVTKPTYLYTAKQGISGKGVLQP